MVSGDNPADLVSRGMRMQDFLKSKLWLEGPEWLKQAEEKWPVPKLIISPQEIKEIKKECKPKMEAHPIMHMTSDKERIMLYDKFQDWDKIINITAYALKLVEIIRR